MTDEDLERLEASARMVAERGGSGFADGLARDMAITVLTLLERVRKAEAQLATIAAHIEYAGKEGGLPDAVQAFVLASTETAKRVLERAREAEAEAEAEAADLNRKLADLERRVLCPNFEHDWAPCQPEGAGFVTECRRCPATIHTVDFRPALKP